MMNFLDKPYTYRPPKHNRFKIGLAQLCNRYAYMPGPSHRIDGVTVVNPEVIQKLRQIPNHRLLFLPNHPTHSDPQIMLEVQRQLGIQSLYLAAYDGFEKNKLHGWVMQQAGAFTVDREGPDRQAIKQSVATLEEGRYGLTVFPEGNVYLTNDRVTPFLEGGAFIGMKAQKKLGDCSIYALPVSIKVTYTEGPCSNIGERVRCLAQEAEVDFNAHGDSVTALKRIGLEILKKSLEERGYPLPKDRDNDIPAYIKGAVESIVVDLEKALDIHSQPKTALIDRVRKVRRMVHAILTDDNKRADYPYASYWADEAMFALRILSYPGEYLEENPTLDRYAETVEKLTEDLYGEVQAPCGNRHAFVYINEPVNLYEYLGDYRTSSRDTLSALTRTIEQSVQNGVDKLNRTNLYPGGKRFVESRSSMVH